MLIYIDDIIVPAKDVAENVERVKNIFEVAEKNGIILKWEKC